MKAARKHAEDFESAERDLEASADEVTWLEDEHATVVESATAARAAFEEAEHQLASVQALHLAEKLVSGEPCPVCGGREHPAPATGLIENAGLDKAFREAKEAWDAAAKSEREAEGKLISAQGVLAERQNRISAAERPARTAAEVSALIESCRNSISDLGVEADIADAEARLEALEGSVADAETERDRCRDVARTGCGRMLPPPRRGWMRRYPVFPTRFATERHSRPRSSRRTER